MEKLLIISAFSFLFTLIGTKLLKNFLENKKIFDIPNERSSHLKPIPTGGGWIINLCIIGIIFFLDPYDKIPAIITISGLSYISWQDDLKNINIGPIIIGYIIIAQIVLLSINSIIIIN